MRTLKSLLSLLILVLFNNLDSQANQFLIQKLSNLMSFPKDKLVISDFTRYEQDLYDGKIYLAKRIDSIVENSFNPIHITIAKKGTLLSDKDKEFLKMLEESGDEKSKEMLGHKIIYDNVCGIYLLGEIYFKTTSKSNPYPSLEYNMTFSCILYPPDSDIEIRIAILANYIENLVPGGEKYYEYFRSVYSAEEIYGDAPGPPEFDLKKFFADFGRAVVESEMVKQIISENSNPNAIGSSDTTSQTNNSPTQVVNPQNRAKLSEEMADAKEHNKSINFVLLLAGTAALLLAGLYIFKKNKN